MEVLREAAADGRLSIDEHGERMESVYSSRTLGELADLTADLVAHPSARPLQADTEPVLAVFGSDKRSGRWVVPAELPVTAVCGEATLDLQEALLERSEVVVNVTAVCGQVTLVVPEGVDVRLSGPTLLGEKKSKVRSPRDPKAPVVSVQCFVAFGEVTAKPPRRKRWFDRLVE